MTTGPAHRATQPDVRHHFDETLAELRHGLVHLGSLVAENLQRAREAMLDNNLELIAAVRDADKEINALYIDLERRTFETLARQQPVAGDLRFLVAATRILYEQERSGDLVVNCVKMLEREEGFPETPAIRGHLSRVIEASARVFAASTDAIADLDPNAGVDLDRADDEVDELVSLFYTEIGTSANEIGLDAAIALSRVGRFLERIADHGVNIGENITYVATARFPDSSQHFPAG